MQKMSLQALARELVERAHGGSSGRAAETVVGGHERVLRQTMIGMLQGGYAGRARKPGRGGTGGRASGPGPSSKAGANAWEGREGDLPIVPDAAHDLEAVEDSAVLLTVAKPG